MLPAHQHLGTDAAAATVDLRLVVQDEFLLQQTLTQFRLQSGMCGHQLLDFRIKEAQRVASGGLGLVHGQIGAFQ